MANLKNEVLSTDNNSAVLASVSAAIAAADAAKTEAPKAQASGIVVENSRRANPASMNVPPGRPENGQLKHWIKVPLLNGQFVPNALRRVIAGETTSFGTAPETKLSLAQITKGLINGWPDKDTTSVTIAGQPSLTVHVSLGRGRSSRVTAIGEDHMDVLRQAIDLCQHMGDKGLSHLEIAGEELGNFGGFARSNNANNGMNLAALNAVYVDGHVETLIPLPGEPDTATANRNLRSNAGRDRANGR